MNTMTMEDFGLHRTDGTYNIQPAGDIGIVHRRLRSRYLRSDGAGFQGLGELVSEPELQEIREEPCIEVAKTQGVRLVDVFALGPLMIWGGTCKALPAWARVALVFSGITTIGYNAKNYLETRERGYADNQAQ